MDKDNNNSISPDKISNNRVFHDETKESTQILERKKERGMTSSLGNSNNNKNFLKILKDNHQCKNVDDFFENIIELSKNENRSLLQSNFIRDFIISITNFQNLHGMYKDLLSYHIHIQNLSQTINYQFLRKNKILFKFGDLGEKYYIILRGTVEVIIPKWNLSKLSLKEYFIYLAKFRIYHEMDLLMEILERNKHIFQIDINDVEDFINFEINTENERKRRECERIERFDKKNFGANSLLLKKRNSVCHQSNSSIFLKLKGFEMEQKNDRIIKINPMRSDSFFDKEKDSYSKVIKNNLSSISSNNLVKVKNQNYIQKNFHGESSLSSYADLSYANNFLNKYSNQNVNTNSDYFNYKNKTNNYFSGNLKEENNKKLQIRSLHTIIEEDKKENFPINKFENLSNEKFLKDKESYQFFESFVYEGNSSSQLERKMTIEFNSSFKNKNIFVDRRKEEEKQEQEKKEEKEKKNEKKKIKFDKNFSPNVINYSGKYFLKHMKSNESLVKIKTAAYKDYFGEKEPIDNPKNSLYEEINTNNFLSTYNENEFGDKLNRKEEEIVFKTKRSLSIAQGDSYNGVIRFRQSLEKLSGNGIEKLKKSPIKIRKFNERNLSESSGSCDETKKSINSSIEQIKNKFKIKFKFAKKDKSINFIDKYYEELQENKALINNVDSDNYIKRFMIINDRKDSFKTTSKLEEINDFKEESEQIETFDVYMITLANVKTMRTGEIFGEVALNEDNKKRTATIISSDDCHFGWSNRENYDSKLSDAKTKNIQNEVNNLLNCPIFRNHNKITFYREIYFMLDKRYVMRSDLIFREGDQLEDIIFLNEGEYCLKIKKNFLEINQLIKKLGGIPDNEHEEMDEISENDEFKKFMETKQELKVYNINKTDVIGFDDYTINKKFLFDLECISPKGKIFTMEKENFKVIEEKNRNLKEFVLNYQIEKRKNIINRLNDIKKSKISIFKRDNKDITQVMNVLAKVSNETYFTHAEINKIEKQSLQQERKKDFKKTINQFKKSSNSKILKISLKESETLTETHKNSNTIKIDKSRELEKKKVSSKILEKLFISTFSVSNSEVMQSNLHKLQNDYFDGNNKNNQNQQEVINTKKKKHSTKKEKIVEKKQDDILLKNNKEEKTELENKPKVKTERSKLKTKPNEKITSLKKNLDIQITEKNKIINTDINTIKLESRDSRIREAAHNSQFRPKDLDFEKIVIKNSAESYIKTTKDHKLTKANIFSKMDNFIVKPREKHPEKSESENVCDILEKKLLGKPNGFYLSNPPKGIVNILDMQIRNEFLKLSEYDKKESDFYFSQEIKANEKKICFTNIIEKSSNQMKKVVFPQILQSPHKTSNNFTFSLKNNVLNNIKMQIVNFSPQREKFFDKMEMRIKHFSNLSGNKEN